MSLCPERSATYCCLSKRAVSRLRKVTVPPLFGEREMVSKVLSPVCGLPVDISKERQVQQRSNKIIEDAEVHDGVTEETGIV